MPPLSPKLVLLLSTTLLGFVPSLAFGGIGDLPGKTVPQPAVKPEAAAKPAGSAKADGIVLTEGSATLRIPHIEVVGSTLSDGDLASLFATKDPKALEARLRMLDAASIVIPEMTSDQNAGGTEVHFTQKQVLLADIHGGRAATGSAAFATLAMKDGKTATNVSIGATTFKGLDLAQVVHLSAGPRADDAEAQKPLCDAVAVDAVSIGRAAPDAVPITVATIQLKGLMGRPLKTEPTASAGDQADAATFDDIVHSFSAELVQADHVALAGPVSGSTNGLKSLALEHVAANGLGGGKLARFELNGLVVEGNDKQPGRLALASAQIENVASNATSVPSVDRIELRDFSMDIPAEPGKQTGHMALAVAHAGYAAPGLVIGKLPAKATLSVEHAAFDLPPDNAAAPMLLAMGYKHLDLSSQSASRYDQAAQTLAIDKLELTGAGMGSLDIKLGLAKVSEGIVSQDEAVEKAAAAALLVKSLDLTLRNDGLVDKAVAFKAAADGVGVEQERQNISELMNLGLAGVGLQESDKAQRIVAALQKFIAEPKTLHIALASKSGLGADSTPLLNDPKALLDAMDVEASAND